MEQHEGIRESSWLEFLVRQCGRTTIEGKVAAVVPFGAFVEVHEGVFGLLPVSEWAQEPQVGASIPVRVSYLDLDRRRISLAPA